MNPARSPWLTRSRHRRSCRWSRRGCWRRAFRARVGNNRRVVQRGRRSWWRFGDRADSRRSRRSRRQRLSSGADRHRHPTSGRRVRHRVPLRHTPTVGTQRQLRTGATVANTVVTGSAPPGRVCLFTNVDTHLVVDVNGFFPASSPFVSLVPARLLETRAVGPGLATADGLFIGLGVRAGGSVTELDSHRSRRSRRQRLRSGADRHRHPTSGRRVRHRVPLRHTTTAGIERQLRARSDRGQHRRLRGRHRRPGLPVHQCQHRPRRRRQRFLPGCRRSCRWSRHGWWRPRSGQGWRPWTGCSSGSVCGLVVR